MKKAAGYCRFFHCHSLSDVFNAKAEEGIRIADAYVFNDLLQILDSPRMKSTRPAPPFHRYNCTVRSGTARISDS
jgi:hypothetical protein